MSSKPDLTRLFELIDDCKYCDFTNYKEKYNLLAEQFIKYDLLTIMERRFEENLDGEYERKKEYLTRLVGSTESQNEFYDVRLLFLKRMVESKDPGGVVYGEVHYFGDQYGRFTAFHEALIEPLGVFLREYCKEDYVEENGAGGLDTIVSQLNDWFKTNRLLITCPKYFLDRDYSLDDNLFFVVGAFKRLHDAGVLDALKSATASEILAPFEIKIQDANIPSTNRITDDIWRFICSAKGVIVDLCKDNFNVAYEVGIAHALGKSTIFLANDSDYPNLSVNLPFDIDDIRVVPYSTDRLDDLSRDILPFITSVIAEKEMWPKCEIDLQVR